MAEVDDGRLIGVKGDRENEVFAGYTCVKGRAQPEAHNHPNRLRSSLKRQSDGTFAPISVTDAMDEIAEQLANIIEEHGARAVAGYFGSMILSSAATQPTMDGFLKALGTPLTFTPNTIDKPGKPIASALIGGWQAPLQGYDDPQAALLIGLNSFQSYYGVACGHPAKWLGARLDAGMDLIVIDPRRTDIARRATLHLQPLPGHDIPILAAMIHVILSENLHDQEFVDHYVTGVRELRRVLSAFEPSVVASRAGVSAEDIVHAARLFAAARRGYAAAGTGAGFSASSTVVEYLILVLESLCGHWLREGERVQRAPTLMTPPRYRAQPSSPRPGYGFGERLEATGLANSAAGMPTGVLADEMLIDGEARVRALLCCAGNPATAWPDQHKVLDALQRLELLVQIDPWMSATARQAHYVIAPKMMYEVPSATFPTDSMMLMPTWYGPAESYAQYTPAIVDPPEGADVIDEWEFFYGLACRLGLEPELSTFMPSERQPWKFDRNRKPTTDEIIEALASGGRVSLDDVKKHPHGSTFPEPACYVEGPDPSSTDRLDVSNSEMLDAVAAYTDGHDRAESDEFSFRLVSRRIQQRYNSTGVDPALGSSRPYNPAFMHSTDLERLGLSDGDRVTVCSERGSIPAIVATDDNLRPGLVSMSHGFGGGPDRDDDYDTIGSCTGRLLDGLDFADPYVGMPRINNIPVDVTPRS